MPLARRLLIDPSRSVVAHCISRCVRRAFLLGEGCDHRREMLRARMALLSEIFAVDVLVFAVMSNHVHLIVRTLPEVVAHWPDREVARRWRLLCPDRKLRERLGIAPDAPPCEEEIDALAADRPRIRALRERLSNLSEYHKYLKQWIARQANLEDECTGHFFEGRFRSIVLLDELAQLMCSLYVLLNPVKAGITKPLETCPDVSLREIVVAARREAMRRGGRTARQTGSMLETMLGEIERLPVEPALPARRDGILDGASPSLEDDRTLAWLRPDGVGPEPPRQALAISLGEFVSRLRQAQSFVVSALGAPRDAEPLAPISFATWLASLFAEPDMPRGTVAGGVASVIAETARRGARRVVAAMRIEYLQQFGGAGGP